MTTSSMQSRAEAFVQYLELALPNNKGLASQLRRADNASTEHFAWETLAKFSIDLEKPYARQPFSTVAAAFARHKDLKNGSMKLGTAIRLAFAEGDSSKSEPASQAISRLRRILACDSVDELCRVLRPLFSLISTRVKGNLDYKRILVQLQRFHFSPDQVKAQIAQEFYSYSGSGNGTEVFGDAP